MKFKFKKGDKVKLLFAEMFAGVFGGTSISTVPVDSCVVTVCRTHNGEHQYKLKGYTGWWAEHNLTKA
jgi:hypothetical protein